MRASSTDPLPFLATVVSYCPSVVSRLAINDNISQPTHIATTYPESLIGITAVSITPITSESIATIRSESRTVCTGTSKATSTVKSELTTTATHILAVARQTPHPSRPLHSLRVARRHTSCDQAAGHHRVEADRLHLS